MFSRHAYCLRHSIEIGKNEQNIYKIKHDKCLLHMHRHTYIYKNQTNRINRTTTRNKFK